MKDRKHKAALTKLRISAHKLHIETGRYKNMMKTLKHRDSKNDWRGSCEIKINNLEFSRLLTNLKMVSELDFIPTKSF